MSTYFLLLKFSIEVERSFLNDILCNNLDLQADFDLQVHLAHTLKLI